MTADFAPATATDRPPARTRPDDLPAVLDLLFKSDEERPRSTSGFGFSSLGDDCDRRAAELLLGTKKTNWTDLLSRVIGTAFHNDAGRAVARLLDGAVVEGSVALDVDGYLLPGHFDLYADRIVEDWKTTTKDRLPSLPTRRQRWQVQTYAHAAAVSGHPVDYVRLVFVPRDGGTDDVVVWEDDYRPDVAEEALDWLRDLLRTLADGDKPEPKKTWTYCVQWCDFYDPEGVGSGCAGLDLRPDELPEITDPEVVEAALAYREALDIETAAKKAKDAAKPLLDGVTGKAAGLVVTHSRPSETEVLDEEAVRLEYELAGGAPPMKPKKTASRLSVKPAPKPKPAKQ